MAKEPSMHSGRFVGREVVENDMDVEIGWNCSFDPLQELEELSCAMTTMALADHLASGNVERSEECGRPVTNVRMRLQFGPRRQHRQHWLSSIERLNLRFLVD